MWQNKIVVSPLFKLHFSKHQTCQDGDLRCATPSYQVPCLFNLVVLWYHITNYKHFIFPFTRPVSIEVGWLVTWDAGLPLKSHTSLWSCDGRMSRDKIKTLYLYYHRTSKYHSGCTGHLGWGAHIYQFVCPFGHVVNCCPQKLQASNFAQWLL